ncbi:ABC transporter ATP-binding protein [Notoacmeibacter sp. MSK16QG-6]|uniref:ABC transporter ATP-binding protein n=1 Tax=Notoacmeibacter sp. MSK16QG-6 TaxID=2957982 RepID=UPI00209E1897|nr:ABC transporter ATP-binding protein [Notoacmeibacter sp. MSK16QG-6]MCP1199528.1 ABC transporter ATP-binding protein [Notoacmeibacter sp. MSK16QG-6]
MLEVKGLAVRYGRHEALHEVSINVAEGETVVILGANGAGKTSLMNAIAGRVSPFSGSIRFLGEEIDDQPSHDRVEAGIALVPEGRGIFPGLSVRDNLKLGGYPKRARENAGSTMERVLTLFPRLAERLDQLAGTMSGGEQQMVAIGRAVMSAPKLLMLDEPSLGLAPIVTQQLFGDLERVRQAGTSMLVVEQNVRAGLKLADRGYLLTAGRIVREAAAADLQGDPDVSRAFLGGLEDAVH